MQFVSREDAEADVLGATIKKGTGALKVKKGYGECPKLTKDARGLQAPDGGCVAFPPSSPAEIPAEGDTTRSSANSFPQLFEIWI